MEQSNLIFKQCKKCGRTLSISMFWKSFTKKAARDGYQSWCKECIYGYQSDNSHKRGEYRRKYLQEHPWLKHQKRAWGRCNSPKHASYPWYGGKGVKMCLTASEIEYLWKIYHADSMHHPTLDRINDTDPECWNYTPSNCRFVEREENIQKSWLKRRAIKEQDRAA